MNTARLTTNEAAAESEDAEFLDTEIWTRLSTAPSTEAFAAAWLDLQCRLVGGVRIAAVLMTPAESEPLAPVAIRPTTAALSPALVAAAERSAMERRGVVRRNESRGTAFALPILIDDDLRGVVALEMLASSRVEARRVMRQLQWGTGWLEVLARRRRPGARDQLVSLIELLASAARKTTFVASASSLVTELAHLLDCNRVSLGRLKGRHTRIRAVSNNANFKHRSREIRAIAAAMDEAIEQRDVIRVPPPRDRPSVATRAHAELLQATGGAALLTVPLHLGGGSVGAITLERTQPFTERDASLLQQLAELITPSLEAMRENDRWMPRRTWDSLISALKIVLGPRHVAAKLATLATLATLAFLALATAPFRVSADAQLEATLRRVIAAPMEGYVASAFVRPGDLVDEGALMAELDDSDLKLEQVRVLSEKAQFQQRYREAFAAEELAEARVLRAQISGADARLALVDERLARTRILAPFDGVVVAGDLSQSLGSPVERGDVLFEVAPLDAYRVVAHVDEHDISMIGEGQGGRIVLTSLPDRTFPFVVEAVTPVSEVADGINRFRVEATLEAEDGSMRPGMEGVAKIDIEERRLLWIWTHRFVWWARMTLWRWWPHV